MANGNQAFFKGHEQVQLIRGLEYWYFLPIAWYLVQIPLEVNLFTQSLICLLVLSTYIPNDPALDPDPLVLVQIVDYKYIVDN